MTYLLNKSKKIISLFAVFLFLIIQNYAPILGLGFLFNTNKIDKVYATYNSTEISLSNSNFENPTSTSYPIALSSWSKLENDNTVVSGAINVLQSVYDENYTDYELPSSDNPSKPSVVNENENKVLMINAKNTSAKLGYQSASFVLSKGGYYTVSAWVYTNNSAASLYLTGNNEVINNDNSKLLGVVTNGDWKQYTFYIQTDEIANKTLNLELYLGAKDNSILSQNAVFFDEVEIMSHSHDMYFTKIANLNPAENNYSVLNLTETKVNNAINNPGFETGLLNDTTGWTVLSENNSIPNSEYAISGIHYIDGNFSSQDTQVATSPTNANRYNNHKALLINNIDEASIGYKSSDILIEQHKIYRLSVWVKTGDLLNGATLKLIQHENADIISTPVTKTIDNIKTINANNEKYENWIQYSFVIRGNVFDDSYVNLELWVGNETKTETGYAFFDEVELYELTTSQYNLISAGTTVSKVDLFSFSATPTVTNGNFNNISVDNTTNTYPYAPTDWNNSLGTDYGVVKNGVINTKPSHFNSNIANYSFANPGNLNNQVNDEISNNVLVMGNVTQTKQTYTSANLTLNASSYYLLSFYLQTQALSENALSIKLLSGTTPLYTLNNLESDLSWTKYNLYIKTTDTTLTSNISLQLGNSEQLITGYAFFDNFRLDTSSATNYNNAVLDATNKKIDFNYENFNSTGTVPTNGLYTPLNYIGNNTNLVGNEFIQAGVLNTDEFSSFEANFVGLENPNTASSDNRNVLMIGSSVDTHYTYTSNLSYTISANTHYKFSVFVKTQGLTQLEENQQLDDNDQVIPFGASVILSNFDNGFTTINTQLNSIENEYQEYIIYILSANEKSTNIILSLGSENAFTKGYVFFSNISLTKIDEEEYTEAITLLQGNNPPTNILNIQDDEVEETEEPEDEENNEEMNFDFLLLPTLITGIALLLAIIGYSIRQIKFNRIIKKRIKTEIYDRNRTLAVDHERREVVKQRQEKLLKLKEELNQITLELEENEKAFKLLKQEEAPLSQTNEKKVLEKLKAFSLKQQQELEKKEPKYSESQLKALKEKQLKAQKAFELKEQKRARKLQGELIKQEKQQQYLEKRERLQKEFDRITKEIEKLEREERLMFEKYQNYKAQVKAIKQEIKEKTNKERIKRKLKRQQMRDKKKQTK